jgi:hypothetical protein
MTRPTEPPDCMCSCHFDRNGRPWVRSRWTAEDHAAAERERAERLAELEAEAKRWEDDPAYRRASAEALRAKLFPRKGRDE